MFGSESSVDYLHRGRSCTSTCIKCPGATLGDSLIGLGFEAGEVFESDKLEKSAKEKFTDTGKKLWMKKFQSKPVVPFTETVSAGCLFAEIGV